MATDFDFYRDVAGYFRADASELPPALVHNHEPAGKLILQDLRTSGNLIVDRACFAAVWAKAHWGVSPHNLFTDESLTWCVTAAKEYGYIDLARALEQYRASGKRFGLVTHENGDSWRGFAARISTPPPVPIPEPGEQSDWQATAPSNGLTETTPFKSIPIGKAAVQESLAVVDDVAAYFASDDEPELENEMEMENDE